MVKENIAWSPSMGETTYLDFTGFEPREITTKKELLHYYDTLLANVKIALANAKDYVFNIDRSINHGAEVLMTLPKKQVVRLFCMNHLVHHRA